MKTPYAPALVWKHPLSFVMVGAFLLATSIHSGAQNVLPGQKDEIRHPLLTALLHEPGWGSNEFRDALVPYKGDLNKIFDSRGMGLLHWAAWKGLENEALHLLLAGADPNIRDKVGQTPLHYTVSGKNYERALVRDLLILRGAQIDSADSTGRTPLMEAVRAGEPSTVELLLWLGANLYPPGVPTGRQPLALAIARKDPRILQIVQGAVAVPPVTRHSAPARIPEFVQQSFTDAARKGDFQILEKNLEAGADINGLDSGGRSALIRAINNQQENVVVYLLLLGANPDRISEDGIPPLGWTMGWFGMTSDYMREALIAAGARTDIVMKNGHSLLTRSALRENEHSAQWMIWTGNDPNKAAPAGTPMRVASEAGNDRLIELLRRNGVTEEPFNDPRPEWQMMRAVKAGNIQKIEELLKLMPADSVITPKGENAMLLAIGSRRMDVAHFLLKHGSDPNFQNPKTGTTPLHYTTGWLFHENEIFRRALLEAGANPNLPDKNGTTPFQAACVYGDLAPKITQMILHGADLTLKDAKGRAPLEISLGNGRTDAHDYLEKMLAPGRKAMLSNALRFLQGTWKYNGTVIEYRSDGTKITTFGGGRQRVGTWKLNGDIITENFEENGKPGSDRYQIIEISAAENTVVLVDGGPLYRGTRIQ